MKRTVRGGAPFPDSMESSVRLCIEIARRSDLDRVDTMRAAYKASPPYRYVGISMTAWPSESLRARLNTRTLFNDNARTTYDSTATVSGTGSNAQTSPDGPTSCDSRCV